MQRHGAGRGTERKIFEETTVADLNGRGVDSECQVEGAVHKGHTYRYDVEDRLVTISLKGS